MFISTIKNFFITLILVSTLFAGQDLESAKIRLKDREWGAAEEFLLKALNHPKDKWEAAFHLGDKIYSRSQEWAKVKEYMDIASTASEKIKIRPTPNDRKIPIKSAILASKARSFTIIYNRTSGYLKLFGSAKNEEMKQTSIQQGIKAAQDLRDFDPNQPGGYGLLAQFYALDRNKVDALESIDKLLTFKDVSDEDKISYYSFAAAIASSFQEYNVASQYYEEGLKIDPNNLTLKIDVGVLYSRLNQHNKAIKQFLSTIDDIENEDLKGDTHFNLGLSYTKIGNIEEAAYHFEEAFILKPDDHQAAYAMAVQLENAQYYRKARKYYRAAKKLEPSNTSYQAGISRTEIKQDQQEAEDKD